MSRLSAQRVPETKDLADVLASSLLLSNGTQVRLTRTFQECDHVGAGRCVRTFLQETVGKRCFAFCIVVHPVVVTPRMQISALRNVACWLSKSKGVY